MRDLDRENLERLQCSDPESWPPILVTRCTAGYLVIDGYHRWEVATGKGIVARYQFFSYTAHQPSEHAIIDFICVH